MKIPTRTSVRGKLAHLFPSLAAMDRVKWLAIPIALLWFFGILIGIADLFFGSRVID